MIFLGGGAEAAIEYVFIVRIFGILTKNIFNQYI